MRFPPGHTLWVKYPAGVFADFTPALRLYCSRNAAVLKERCIVFHRASNGFVSVGHLERPLAIEATWWA